MMTVRVRKQGGAAVMTIPADILNVLDLHVGSRLQILPQVDGFSVRAVAEPVAASVAKRLSLRDLLRGATAGNMNKLRLQSVGALDGAPVGHELI
jgi:antitoxin ChpS